VSAALLSIRDLRVRFSGGRDLVHAVNGVDIDVGAGETVGIVGESGSGKTVTSLATMGLLPPTAQITGSIRFDGTELVGLDERRWRRVRGRGIAMVFQDPMTSLNPVMPIGRQITESVLEHHDLTAKAARLRAIDLLEQVGIPDPARHVDVYPHQLSGGMRQRVVIAIALAGEPRLLVADEPTTALDVTIQAQILDLLRRLISGRSTSLLLITHDLGVVAGVCERASVMYAGRVVEEGPVGALFREPRHHYTVGLLGSIPTADLPRKSLLASIAGRPPQLHREPDACAFAARCPGVRSDCHATVSALRPAERSATAHRAACLHPVGSDPMDEVNA
jgi:peptide/nickel transport system ATP-binding protein